MALLAKSNLLCLLITCSVSIFVYAGTKEEKKDVKYFNTPVKFFEFGKGCEECGEDTTIQKAENEKPIETADYQLYVFISLAEETEETNKQVIQETKQFLNRHPEVVARGYLLDRMENIKNLALKNHSLFDDTLTFEFDPQMRKAIEKKVNQVPLVVLQQKNKELLRATGHIFDKLNEAIDRK